MAKLSARGRHVVAAVIDLARALDVPSPVLREPGVPVDGLVRHPVLFAERKRCRTTCQLGQDLGDLFGAEFWRTHGVIKTTTSILWEPKYRRSFIQGLDKRADL